MSDLVVTVPKRLWQEWIAEGDLPGEPWSGAYSHFWVGSAPDRDRLLGAPDARVYIVSHGRLRGYAPLFDVEFRCRLAPRRSCLLRRGDAVAVTIDEPIHGFRGWRYRWWDRYEELPFPDWRTAGVTS